jgi:uncharacterized protein (UPF0179 family)
MHIVVNIVHVSKKFLPQMLESKKSTNGAIIYNFSYMYIYNTD